MSMTKPTNPGYHLASVYLIGSLRNPELEGLAETLRARFPGIEFFASWLAAGPEADDHWKAYEQGRGLTFREALADYAAQDVLSFDKHHLDRCDMAVLVGPAGKSAHTELGYMIGSGKPTIYYLPEEPQADRWDVMIGLAGAVAIGLDGLIGSLKPHLSSSQSERAVGAPGGSPPKDDEPPTWDFPAQFLLGRDFMWSPWEGHRWVRPPLDTRHVHAFVTADGYWWDDVNGFTHYASQPVQRMYGDLVGQTGLCPSDALNE